MREVNIFTDWQELKGLVGKGKLLQRKGVGLPFILEEADNETFQEIFYCERWLVEFPNGFRKICCVRKRKRTQLSRNQQEYASDLKDTFLTFNGKEIF